MKKSTSYIYYQRKLAEIRTSKAMSQAYLAELLGKQQSYISKYESGERRLDVGEFLDICVCLGVDISEVVGFVDKKDEKIMREISASEFLAELENDGIVGSKGEIRFNLKGKSVVVKSKDSVGNMLQSWLEEWAKDKGIYLEANPSTQEFPDFYLDKAHRNLLEIKSYDYDASPNFDVANFETYVNALLEKPLNIDADYIVFGYTLDSNGILAIKEMKLKKIWEITTSSKDWGLKLQVKKGMVYNIRPVSFGSRGKYKPFSSKVEFAKAIQTVLDKYHKTKDDGSSNGWLEKFKKAYESKKGMLFE